MLLSTKGRDFLKDYEKLRLAAYKDQRGTWTIGWGCTTYQDGRPVKKGDVITKEAADALFDYHLSNCERAVNRLVAKVVLNQHQFDALVVFGYNVGTGTEGLAGSTMLRLIKINPKDPAIGKEFPRWNKIRVLGVLVPSRGLTLRRTAEWMMYDSGLYA